MQTAEPLLVQLPSVVTSRMSFILFVGPLQHFIDPGCGVNTGVHEEAAAIGAAPKATTAGTAQAAPLATVRRDSPCGWLFSMMPPM